MRATLSALITLTAAVLAVAACDELPRDPEDTFAKARQGPLRVGLVESPPWTRYEQQHPSGVEVELIEQFAAELGVQVHWVPGGESELMPALERFELHLVIGGMTRSNPWSQRVGFSRPYFINRFVVGVPSGEQRETIAGLPVAVQEGSPLAAMLREREAEVVPLPDLRAAEVEAVAAPYWQLELLGRESTGIELHREEHVMAVPPGENGWLMRLDAFLHREAVNLPDRLRQVEAAR